MKGADARLALAEAWLAGRFSGSLRLAPLAGDASFRRYFRVYRGEETWVLMDAPPEKEDVGPFLSVRRWMQAGGLNVPQLLAEDRQAGFLVLDDFGDRTWARVLAEGGDAVPMMADAQDQLHRLQAIPDPGGLPVFDAARMRRECDLYLDWYLPHGAGIRPDAPARAAFHAALAPVLAEIEALPRVPVHLDYHSRNLMLPPVGLPLGVIDFQDAVAGPVTYDLASLLYDCYQDYAEAERKAWSLGFFAALPASLHAAFADGEAWHRALRLTAFQRHIKAIGIFARLAHRDGKRRFLDEIPLTRRHLADEIVALGLPEPPGLDA